MNDYVALFSDSDLPIIILQEITFQPPTHSKPSGVMNKPPLAAAKGSAKTPEPIQSLEKLLVVQNKLEPLPSEPDVISTVIVTEADGVFFSSEELFNYCISTLTTKLRTISYPTLL